MDAKDRLRRYLEQRREMGESELILDSLSVDDVLRMLGAPAAAPSPAKATAKPTATNADTSRVPRQRDDVLQVEPPIANKPGIESPTQREQPGAAPTSSDATDAVDVPSDVPATPAVRFDASAPTDWRAALRNANLTDARDARVVQAPSDATPPTARLHEAVPAWLSALQIPTGLTISASVELSSVVLPTDSVRALNTLEEIAGMVAGCRACALGFSALNAVPGEGNPNADVVCVGEAPGQTEDETGRPFVGAAGQLLTKILGAIQLSREDVFICNVLKHRPPGNRNPLPEEVRACTPYLTRQLELLKPKVIIALGTFAAQTLLNTPVAMGKLRGQLHRYHNIPLIVTYHPSALLRNENWKRPAWDDVRLARRILDAARAASTSAN